MQTVGTVNEMNLHGNEAANCEHMSITVDMLGEIKRDQTEKFWLFRFLNVLCCHRVTCIC